MKEATGELNMTVVTVVAIAAVGAFFYAFVWPSIKNSITASTDCSNAVCSDCEESNGKRVCKTCTYTKSDGTEGTRSCTFNDTTSNQGTTTN